MAAHDVKARLGEITAPTTVLSGEQDQVHPTHAQQAMAQAIPNARLVSIQATHMSVLDAPEVFSDAVLDHLEWVGRYIST